ITWDADSAEAGEVPAAAGTESRDGEAGAGPETAEPGMAGAGTTGPDGEAELSEDDVAVTEGAPRPDATPAIGESGRWFRPAKAEKEYVPIPPEDQADSAGLDVAPADPEPDGAAATQDPAEPDGAVATEEAPEQTAEPEASMSAGPAGAEAEAGAEPEAEAGAEPEAEASAEPEAEASADGDAGADGDAEAEAGADGDAAPADWTSQDQPEWVSAQEARPAEVWTPPYQAAGQATSAAGRVGSPAGRVGSSAGRVGSSAAGRVSA